MSTEDVLIHHLQAFGAGDAFVVRDGKIAVQTFAAQINPK